MKHMSWFKTYNLKCDLDPKLAKMLRSNNISATSNSKEDSLKKVKTN